ncbi:sulfite exporter TauE/SafE family protein [uncultured Dechloromonas sp.]|uniref:sulfite exporter TauE/SafE family protein n=1 Tax=uncultured Dechloromonas sp. TaxID=171719 RepID=UPI0025E83EFA|nr:sulfite exporter TauE/SafE family protein [uncultured Dechloromonas sp.]
MPADIVATLPVALLAVICGYALFSLFGFGSAILAAPGLVLVMPMARIVPLLALLDAGSSALRAWRGRAAIDIAAIRLLLPCMLAGQILGVGLLRCLPVRETGLLFGGFIALLGLSSLRQRAQRQGGAGGTWSGIGHGLAGGVLGGMFGSGGFLYARYLQRHLPQQDRFLATQAVMIGISTAWRVVLCLLSGLIDGGLLMTALVLAPAVWAGFGIGRLAQGRISRQRGVVLLNGLLVVAGLLLVYRHLA